MSQMHLRAIGQAPTDLVRNIIRQILSRSAVRAYLARSRERAVDGHALDRESAALLGLGELLGDIDWNTVSTEEARARTRATSLIADEVPRHPVQVTPIRVVAGKVELDARLYVPAGIETPSPGLFFLHGGAFVFCDLDTHDGLCRRLAGSGSVRVVSLAYRLAPEHPFPASVLDALEGFRWTARKAERLGIDPNRLGIGGDSAGGNLSAVVAQLTRDDALRPRTQVLIYPATDASRKHPSRISLGEGYYLSQRTMDWATSRYAPDASSALDPRRSPLLASDLTGLAPALVYTAGFDPLRDEGQAYATRLQASGVPTTHRCFHQLMHGFCLMTGLSPAALEATEAIAREVGQALRSP